MADDATISEAVVGLRAVLAEIDAGELECSPVYRRCLEGAVIALDAATGPESPSSAR